MEPARERFADRAEIDQQRWVLWSNGKKLRKIGKIVGIANSSVCQRLANAVDCVAGRREWTTKGTVYAI